MERIEVKVYWNDKNFECGWSDTELGVVIVTGATLEGVKAEFAAALEEHIEDMCAEGEPVAQWLIDKDYEIVYDLEVSAILRNAEQYTTMAAISRVSGINQKLLSHYASSVKRPRPAQRKRIVDALHTIGNTFLAIC